MVRNRKVSPEKPENIQITVKRSPDMIFTVLCVLLIFLGSVMLFSAGSYYSKVGYGDSFYTLREHIKHLLVGGAAAAAFIIVLSPKNIKIISILMYAAGILGLIAVLIFGFSAGGAKRWIDLGFMSFQPSEFAKTAMIMMIACYMSDVDKRIGAKMGSGKKRKGWYHFLYVFLYPMILIVAPVAGLVALEKHLSGTIIVLAIGAVTVFVGGASILCYLVLIPVLTPFGFIAAQVPYVKDRLTGWTNRGADALGKDWQTTQGLYAIGTGGLFGLGLGQSRLKYGYVSQPQNDFVFTIICEELGFVGAAAIILLFVALCSRGFVLAMRSENRLCGIAIAGISFKIIVHVFLNIAVVTGLFPNTGISLPFFSSGGSATLMQIADAGIVIGLSKYSTGDRY